jgi:hypothetical protein
VAGERDGREMMSMHRWMALGLGLALAASAHAEPGNLSDGFAGTEGLTWEAQRGDWSLRDGVYHAAGTGETFLKGAVFGDVDAQVGLRMSDPLIAADWAGLVLTAEPSGLWGSGYLIYLRLSGVVELYRGGKTLAAAASGAEADLAAGRWVRLGVRTAGKHITVSVNGQTRLEYEADAAPVGCVGLAACDVSADFDNFSASGDLWGNLITGQVLMQPEQTPVAGVPVEIYHSMDGYDSPLTAQTVTDESGRYTFRDLPVGERAYWLRTGKSGFGGGTAWFVSVQDGAPTTADLFLVPVPTHDVWVPATAAREVKGFQVVPDLQCATGSRMELKARRRPDQKPEWWLTLDFELPCGGDWVPWFGAGLYPQPHYWSDFWWSLDGGKPVRASQSLQIQGARYGDRATLVWASGAPRGLKAGKHSLKLLVRDPAAAGPASVEARYAWILDAVAFTQLPRATSPADGETVATEMPVLRWGAPAGPRRYTVQYSMEPDFSNGTVTVGGLSSAEFRPWLPLADGVYYWRLKALDVNEGPYGAPFTQPRKFVVSTGAPAIRNVRVASRGPQWAVIAWETDRPCTSLVRWGLAARDYSRSTPCAGTPTRQHRVRLAGLEPMTYYYYAPQVRGDDGKTCMTLPRGFCTPRGAIGDHNSPFGVFGQGLTYSHEMGAAGARWYSDYWDWGALNPARGRYNWTQAEERLARARDSQVDLTVTFWGTPAWIRPSHPDQFTYGPDDLQDARDFFRELAAHCQRRARYWLPWIEPNVGRDPTFGFPLGYWSNRPHARSYAAYQRAASEGVRAGEPDARVVGMNTAGVDLDFIRKCYDEGAAADFDVMNVHYYAISEPFEKQDPEALFASLRALMREYGDAEKPILCSEGGGASSGVPGTSEDSQADNLIRIFIISIANDISKLEWTFELDEKPYGSKRVDMIMWMGLFRFDPKTTPGNPVGEPKPSYFAYKTMAQNLYGTAYQRRLDTAPGIRAYRFAGLRQRVTVAWAAEGEADLEVPVTGNNLRLINRLGESSPVPVAGGRAKLHLTGSPVFLREDDDMRSVPAPTKTGGKQ